MRILNVNIPPDASLNLGEITMAQLGAVVVITGRNGAGKSRLLRKLLKWSNDFMLESDIEKQIMGTEQALLKPSTSATSRTVLERNLRKLNQLKVTQPWVKRSGDHKPTIVAFVPNKLTLKDPNDIGRKEIMEASREVETPGVTDLHSGTFARIQLLQDQKYELTHPDRAKKENESQKVIDDFARLEQLVKQFLHTPITRSTNGEAELFNLPLGRTALSDGQKIILQLCVAIHAQGAKLNDLIIFMDEPENHLHPAALLDLVQAVQKHIGNGQLWVATHSVSLLAEVDPSSIWWMENNTISKAGSQPEKVLTGLLGDDPRRERLAGFLDLPFALASNRFAAECLTPPPTVSHKQNDPQTHQIREVLEGIRTTSNQFRILDFGAGKGRLALELAESWTKEQRRQLEYIAYDPSTRDSEDCLAAITRLLENSTDRLFNDAQSMRARYDEGSFDVVVMCNVLHEIAPSDWADLFGADGTITRFLKDDGFLLLVEVQQLPYGEKAHKNGFLVLDSAQLKKLFAITEADLSGFVVNSQRDGWLKAHLVAKPLLARYNTAAKESAIKDLALMARDRIRVLREQPPDYRHGRMHGFWVQQFANAQHALG